MKLSLCAFLLLFSVSGWAFETGDLISFGKAPVCKSRESLEVLAEGFGKEDISVVWMQYQRSGECSPGKTLYFVIVRETHGVLRFGQYIMQVVEFTAQDGKSRFVPLSDPRQPSM